MTRHTFSLMLLLFSLLLLPIFSFGAQAENEPVESLLAAAIQENCPDCQLLDYAPIGQEQTEYIILTLDSEEKPAVMIVNTEQPAAGVAVRNDKILEGIPLDTGTVQIQDHMLDGYPYIEYRAADDSEFLYVVFIKTRVASGKSIKRNLATNGTIYTGSGMKTEIRSFISILQEMS